MNLSPLNGMEVYFLRIKLNFFHTRYDSRTSLQKRSQ